MPRYSYPHVLDNGHGERLVFERRVPTPNGDRLEVTNEVQPGAGPPMHVHHLQSESLTVLEGRIGWQRPGQAPQYAGPGETVTFPAGEAHRFWNAGDTVVRCRGWVEPADSIEYYLSELFASTAQSPAARPHPLDAAWLVRRYRSEFSMLAIPALVQRLVFPVLVAIGTLTGRYAKYADAPEPVRR